MYWRVRKITPEQLLRQYSIHIIVVVSLFGNLIQFISRPKKEVVTNQMKNDFGVFAKQVTTHLLDTSYINYTESTSRLQGELSDAVKIKLGSATRSRNSTATPTPTSSPPCQTSVGTPRLFSSCRSTTCAR